MWYALRLNFTLDNIYCALMNGIIMVRYIVYYIWINKGVCGIMYVELYMLYTIVYM